MNSSERPRWRNVKHFAGLFLVVLSSWVSDVAAQAVTTVFVGCTTTQSGKAVINEVNTNANFIEVYLKNSADVSNWALYVDAAKIKTLGAGNCTINGTATADNQSTGATSTAWPAGTFISCVNNMNPSNNEVLLSDSSINRLGTPGNQVIDYLSYGTPSPRPSWSVGSDCGTLYPTHDANNKDIARLPDGGGVLADNGNNSSPGVSNATTVSVANLALSEGDSGINNATFTLTLNRTAASAVTVQYATSNGTATGGSSCTTGVDFIHASGPATISIGALTQTVSVQVCGDSLNESDETFNVTLTNPQPSASVYVGTSPATATIVNDDPQRYEVSLATDSINCLPTTVTVTACSDATIPCKPLTSISGATATLSTSAGTLASTALTSTTLTFNAAGVATTTLSYANASDPSAVATLTLDELKAAAPDTRQCCHSGICTRSDTCSTTFHTAGFIISSAPDGIETTIPTQTAGLVSANYVLRAIKSSTRTNVAPNPTAACVAALPAGTHTVDWAYRCNNPSTCSSSNLMSINAGTATTVQGNANTGALIDTSVNMAFDGNGNAPFTFAYSDVGEVTLWARKTINSAVLVGGFGPFVTKPAGFVISGIQQTASPALTNPAATTASGAKFVKAGESFTATVTATTTGGVATPNFGRETAPEGVKLTHALVLPTVGTNGTLSNGTIPGGSFNNGEATVTNLSWDEVGILSLTPSVADADYLGVGNVTVTTSSNIGRFYPDHFETAIIATATAPLSCPSALTCPTLYNGIVYSGQAFSVRVTAKNTNNGTTSNYATTYGLSRDVTLGAWDALGSVTTANPPGAGVLTNGTVLSTSFSAGVGTTSTPTYALPSSTTAPTNVFFRAVESLDSTVTSLRATPANSVEGGVKVVSGRIRINNMYGSDRLSLPMTAAVQYYTGTNWVTSTSDNVTSFNTNLSSVTGGNLVATIQTGLTGSNPLTVRSPGSAAVVAGVRIFTLEAPNQQGSVDLSLNAPTYLPSSTARATFGIYRSPLIYRRENF